MAKMQLDISGKGWSIMEEQVTTMDVTFEERTIDDRIAKINALYRLSLMDLGYSPDEHLENIDLWRLEHYQTRASAQFLLKVMDLYYHMDEMERRIFYTEILEKGRHYHWWWLEFEVRRDYALSCVDVYSQISQSF